MEGSQIKGNLQDADEKERAARHRRLWILLASIVSFFVAFWWLDFRLAASNTQSEKNVTTTSIGMAEQLPDAMQRRQTINLALAGEGPLVIALQKALAVEIKKAGIGDIELVEAFVSKYQGPVLVVKVGKPGSLWMPFFVTSRLTVQAGYSSSGDNTLLGETPVTVDNSAGPVITMYGEYKVTDRSWGLISRPGYYHMLADDLAQQIVASLKDLYRVST
ncbi:MAG TPA: hypothetical protein VK909_18270 [Anaerolineales bacterium]|nr:hypothetical protein [Anaerolineales bacterium]